MLPDRNYSESVIFQFRNQVKEYMNFSRKISEKMDSSDIKKLNELDINMQESLDLVAWVVNMLDFHNEEASHAVLSSLTELGTRLQIIKSILLKSQALPNSNIDIKLIDDISKKISPTLLLTVDKTNATAKKKIASSDVKSEEMMNQNAGSLSYFTNQRRVLSSASFTKPVGKSVRSYVLIKDTDNPKRVDAIFSILKEVRGDSKLESINDQKGQPILDQFGSSIFVPFQFAKDVVRSESISLQNQKILGRKEGKIDGNPSEAARKLYENFGKLAGGRIMNMCCQGTMAGPLVEFVYKADVFKLGNKFLPVVNSDSGNRIDILRDYENKAVVISMKCLMKLSDGNNPGRGIVGQFIEKTVIRIPFDILENELLLDEVSRLGIHAEDSVSKLVKDYEVVELFEKF